MNDLDYRRMIKDFEINARHIEYLKKMKKKREVRSKRYDETIQHMKEIKEQYFQKQRQIFRQKLQKRQKTLLITLQEDSKGNSKEQEKTLINFNEREALTRRNIIKHFRQQEKNRLQFEKNMLDKSKIIIYNFQWKT